MSKEEKGASLFALTTLRKCYLSPEPAPSTSSCFCSQLPWRRVRSDVARSNYNSNRCSLSTNGWQVEC